MRVEAYCSKCGAKVECSGQVVKFTDKKGHTYPRIEGHCVPYGHRVVRRLPRDWRSPGKGKEDASMGTKLSKDLSAGLSVEIPVRVQTETDVKPRWWLLRGLLKGLMSRSGGSHTSVVSQAKAYADMAEGDASTSSRRSADIAEEVGEECSELFGFLLVHEGFTPEMWMALMPPELRAVRPEASLVEVSSTGNTQADRFQAAAGGGSPVPRLPGPSGGGVGAAVLGGVERVANQIIDGTPIGSVVPSLDLNGDGQRLQIIGGQNSGQQAQLALQFMQRLAANGG